MENNVIVGSIPWVVACLTAVCAGVVAYKASINPVRWAVGGAILGLVGTTLVLGVAQAMFIPMSNAEITPYRIKATLVAVVAVFCLGGLFAASMQPHLFARWRRVPKAAKEFVKESAVEVAAKPPGDPRKT